MSGVVNGVTSVVRLEPFRGTSLQYMVRTSRRKARFEAN